MTWKSMNLLFEPPEPLKMASLPVDWMAATMADGAAKIACQGLVECQTSDMRMGRTCSFDGHELIFEVGFDFLDAAKLEQRA
jgi:hypothetical protein